MAKTIVQYFQAKPNKLFPEQLRNLLRFARYNKPVKCAMCGSVRKNHWTLLCPFQAANFGEHQFTIKFRDQIFQPGDPLCTKHFLKPAIPENLWLS